MPTVIIEAQQAFAGVPMIDPPRKRWNRAECAALEASGLWDQQHLELVNGELISKMGKGRPHVYAVSLVYPWLLRVFGEQFVSPEAPIDLAPEDNPTNEPEPDLIVLARPSREIQSGNPQPADLRLVVEISDSTLRFDLTVKAALYARAAIVEYWVVDVSARRIIVHRDPRDGAYRSIEAYNDQEAVRPLASPSDAFPVSSAFPG
jgi:Uma2 family endonuclease